MILNAYKATVKSEMRDVLKQTLQQQKINIIRDFYETGKIMSMSVFLLDDTLFCYVESINELISPEMLFDDAPKYLIPLPDLQGRLFRHMTEIFHFHVPQSEEHWRRKQKPDFCFGMIARIIPSMAARYIYYHYQYQEEQPGKGDKYSRIFLSDDTAFFYGEIPEIIEPVSYQGALSTHNTPPESKWQKIMDEHFIPWDSSFPKYDGKNYDWQKNGYPHGQRNCRKSMVSSYKLLQLRRTVAAHVTGCAAHHLSV